jgi:hypothetical protein
MRWIFQKVPLRSLRRCFLFPLGGFLIFGEQKYVLFFNYIPAENIFNVAKAGLVFVTAFLTRRAMTKYLSEIAWETEVWIAEAPSHIIHFNGERFLGPYE